MARRPVGPVDAVAGPLRTVAARLWSYSASRGGMVFVAASMAVNVSNFLFHVVLSRLLGPSAYGALGALLNVTTVLGVPLTAVSVTVAQSIARRSEPANTPPLGRLLRLALVAAVVGVGLWLAATPTIDRFFHLHSPGATVVLGLWLVPALPSAVLEGVLLGQRRFRVAGIGQLTATGSRLLAGVVLVAAGFGVIGGVVATLVASTVIVACYAMALRPALFRRGRFVPRATDALLSTVALGGAAILTTIDVWLARHFLAPHSAGLFAAAATAGNIALFLPGVVTLIYFPRLAATGGSGPEARQVLARATGFVAMLGLASAGVMALVPGLAVDLLFGPGFAHASVALGTVAVADAGIGIAVCLIYYQVARRSRLALAAWPTCLVALGLAAAFHGTIEVLALDMLVASGALVLGLGVPTLVQALRSLADDTASLPRQAILLEPATADLTVVVPCHNVGAQRLARHLTGICKTLASAGVDFELIPVSDGSTDGSEQAFDQLPGDVVQPIVWTDNRGKGEALRIGLARGRGRYLGFIDGDGDIPADGLAGFVALARRQQPDVVVGSKRHPDAQVVYPPLRRAYSVGYQLLTRMLFGLRVRDTQTGIKLIRRDVVAEVLPRMVEKRFAFDLELLAVAHRLGYRQVAELPVVIGERFGSSISPRSVWRMLQDTLATFWRLRLLRFYDPPLAEPSVVDQAAGLLGSVPRAEAAVVGPGREHEVASLGEAMLLGEPVLLGEPALVGSVGSAPGPSVPVAHVVDPAGLPERLQARERLRILVCNWRDLTHPHAGGAEVYTHRVASAWVAAGHQVTWFCAAVADRPSVERIDGITVVRRGGRHSVYRQARLFWERQGRGRFDLVVDEVNTRPFEATRWAGDTPVVALVHQVAREVWFHEMPWPLAVLGRFLLEPRWLRRLRATPVLTVSDSARASLAGFGVTDVAVVPEGIDPVGRPAVEREHVPTMVFVGRLARNKRPDHAVEAFRLLRRSVPDARLWVIGSGPMQDQIRREAPPGVELLGRLSEVDKRERLARAHCLVATSVREGWGLTVTEAAQVGTPAVAYDVDGLRDSVTASGGVLVAPAPEALAGALAERLPVWTAGQMPAVEAGGVLPWPAVADALLDQAIGRVAARRSAAERGEDVAMAWRRAMAPLAAVCDRRAWSVAGIAALVAVAPLSEAVQGNAADVAAGAALACLVVAAVGTWADSMRWPLVAAAAGPADDRRRGRWAPLAWVGTLAALAVQTWFGAGGFAPGVRGPAVGAAWVRQLGVAFSPGQRGTPGALVAVLQLPVGVTGSLLHVVGVSTAVNERLWVTVLFAAAGMALTELLLVLGFAARAAVVGGLVYVFSPYVLAMSGFDVAYLAAMAVVPGLVAWVVWAARPVPWSPRRVVWAVGWLTLGAGALGLVAGSPPLLLACVAALVGAVLLVGWLEGGRALRRALRRTAVGAGALVIGCAYWTVPFGLELASTRMVTAASHRSWQWAATRSTLANSFWLNTSWDWANLRVFPYAGEFHHFPLVLWRYAVPVVAFASAGVAGWQARARRDQQRLRLLVAAMVLALVVVVVATGNRAPGAPVFGLLTAVPFGWLLEDPGRFLFVADAGYAVMVALLIDQSATSMAGIHASDAIRPVPPIWRRADRPSVIPQVLIVLALLVPAYPLVTGAAGSPLPTSSVRPVPRGVSDPRHVLPIHGLVAASAGATLGTRTLRSWRTWTAWHCYTYDRRGQQGVVLYWSRERCRTGLPQPPAIATEYDVQQ